MSKPTFGEHGKEGQKELCLKYAAELQGAQALPVTPTEITNLCFKRDLFPDAQLKFWTFQAARRWVEQCLKTVDDTGLGIWAQLPLTDGNGEMFWQPRRSMMIEGYAWNYLLRDDCVERNTVRRDKWRAEAVRTFGASKFNAEVKRLRLEREGRAA